jgi:hypothetical protein
MRVMGSLRAIRQRRFAMLRRCEMAIAAGLFRVGRAPALV